MESRKVRVFFALYGGYCGSLAGSARRYWAFFVRCCFSVQFGQRLFPLMALPGPVFTQTEFLAALTRLGGADKSEFYLLLVG